MHFKDYLVVMAIGTVAAWAAFLIVLFTTDPVQATPFGFVLFYLTFAFAAVGTLAIAGSAVRVRLRPQELVSRHVARAFRQAILVAVLLVVCLLLLAAGSFRLWTGALLVLLAAVVELAFLGMHARLKHVE